MTEHRGKVQCAILAGGLATRMHPLTSSIPKALLPICGRPFARYQLERLRQGGVTDVVYCVGRFGDQIRDVVGDGSSLGVRVTYSDDGPHPLGTGGALKSAAARGLLDETFLVTYGDSYLRVTFEQVLDALKTQNSPAILVIHANDGRWDASNVCVGDNQLIEYDKRLTGNPAFTHIDYGVAALRRSLLDELPSGASDLGDLYYELGRTERLGSFIATDRFFEVGSMRGMRDFEAWVKEQPPESLCRA